MLCNIDESEVGVITSYIVPSQDMHVAGVILVLCK